MNVYTLYHHNTQELLGVFDERYKAMEYARAHRQEHYPASAPGEEGVWGMQECLVNTWNYDCYGHASAPTPFLQFTIEKHEVRG